MNIRVPVGLWLAVALVVGFTHPLSLHAQARDVTRPWISVAVPVTERDDARSQALARVVADNLELTLRLIGRYVVRPRPTTRTGVSDAAAAADLAESEQLDYVVFGAVSVREDGATVVSLSVFERDAGTVTLQREAVAVSLFDTFDVADQLAAELLGAFSGQRIAYGRIELVNTADPAGEYLVILDGTTVGRSISELERVLVGERRLEIEVLEGSTAGERILTQTLVVSENARAEIRFSVGVPVVEEVAVHEEAVPAPETEVPVTEEPVAEEPTTGEPARLPWSRNTVAVPGRRPVVSIVPGFTQWNFPHPEVDRAGFTGTAGFQLSVDVDYPALWIVGGGLRSTTSALQVSYESTEAGLQALVDGSYTIELEAASTVFLHGGIRLLEWEGNEWRRDVAVLGTLGFTAVFYYFHVGGGEWIDTAFDAYDEWMSQDHAFAGGRVAFRAHRRRFTLRAGLDVQYNWPVGQEITGREIYLWNSNEVDSGYEPTGIPFPRGFEPVWTWGWDLGIGFSMGGRPRR